MNKAHPLSTSVINEYMYENLRKPHERIRFH